MKLYSEQEVKDFVVEDGFAILAPGIKKTGSGKEHFVALAGRGKVGDKILYWNKKSIGGRRSSEVKYELIDSGKVIAGLGKEYDIELAGGKKLKHQNYYI